MDTGRVARVRRRNRHAGKSRTLKLVLRATTGQHASARTHRGAARRASGGGAGAHRRIGSADGIDLPFRARAPARLARSSCCRNLAIRRCRSWRAPGGWRCARMRSIPPTRFAQTAERGARGRGFRHARGVRQFAAQPHGFGHGPRRNSAKLAAVLAARGIPLIVDEVYHPLYFSGDVPTAASIAQHASCSAISRRRCRFRAFASAGSSIAMPRRREAIIDARSYFTISNSPLTEALGALALANMRTVILRAAARGRAGQSRAAHEVHGRRIASEIEFAPPAGGTTCFPQAARWPRRAAALRSAGPGRRAGRARRLLRGTCAHAHRIWRAAPGIRGGAGSIRRGACPEPAPA